MLLENSFQTVSMPSEKKIKENFQFQYSEKASFQGFVSLCGINFSKKLKFKKNF